MDVSLNYNTASRIRPNLGNRSSGPLTNCANATLTLLSLETSNSSVLNNKIANFGPSEDLTWRTARIQERPPARLRLLICNFLGPAETRPDSDNVVLGVVDFAPCQIMRWRCEPALWFPTRSVTGRSWTADDKQRDYRCTMAAHSGGDNEHTKQ